MDLYLILLIFIGATVLVLVFMYLKQRDTLIHVYSLHENLLARNKELEERIHEHKRDYAVLHSRFVSESDASKEKLEILRNAKEELGKEFVVLANKIFEDKTKQFDHTHKEQFEMLLKPFREQITNFSLQSKEQFTTELKDRHLLKDELDRLKQMNEQLSQDALNLTKALKGENKTQGNWGEMVLERILEESGLRKGFEYETQATLKSDDGKIYRPDVIIHMPQERDIIIDSKVSLLAYERFISKEDPHAKSQALKEHISSISGHIKGLSEKKYEKLEGVKTLDFVLLFMPIEGAFLLALEQDGEFFKRAYANNILVVSPSTLLVTLRTIEHIWRTQRQEEHAKRIADEAEAMYDKLVLFVNEMQNIGSNIQKTQSSYNNAMKRLKSGRGNVIQRAENMKELGLRPKKTLSIKSEDTDEGE
ncbi:DNA recombination protein RmuC [bacterium]|nr:DNA recombination protein RmuC [bacterium]MBU1989778.1 DNA recombination protein RmuC [bacterium]